jgi:undecaprenyl-diphosphatase
MITIPTQRFPTDLKLRLWILAVLLGFLSSCVSKGYLGYFDQYFFRVITRIQNERFDELFKTISFFGSSTWLILGLCVLFIYEWKKTGRRAVSILLGAFAISFGLEIVLRFAVAHLRPDVLPLWPGANLFERFEAFGFPSGHGLRSAFIFGWIAMAEGAKNKRSIASLVCVQLCVWMILLVGVSRVYLNRHWPSDILGSWLLVWTVFTLVCLWRAGREPLKR